jgi:hypothetical protein
LLFLFYAQFLARLQWKYAPKAQCRIAQPQVTANFLYFTPIHMIAIGFFIAVTAWHIV